MREYTQGNCDKCFSLKICFLKYQKMHTGKKHIDEAPVNIFWYFTKKNPRKTLITMDAFPCVYSLVFLQKKMPQLRFEQEAKKGQEVSFWGLFDI